MKKKILIVLSIIVLILFGWFGISHCFSKKNLTIDEILATKSYSYLSSNVKEYIKEHYEETGEILLTKEDAKEGDSYLNPNYIEYLDSDKKDEYGIIPSSTAYTPKIVKSNIILPSKFDLRDVNGKNFVTPNKNQGQEGLCWAYATASLLETHDLITKNKSYDNSAILISEKQMDYALSTDGIIGGNMIFDEQRKLSTGAPLNSVGKLLSKRLGGFQETWNVANSSIIDNNQQLEPYIVFDEGKALYEIDETISLQNINSDLSNIELNESIINEVKKAVYNNGGAIVSIDPSHVFLNALTSDYSSVISQENKNKSRQHALHLIGWDDNYEYVYCRVKYDGLYVSERTAKIDNNTGQTYCEIPEEILGIEPTVEKMSGKGAWILKNSWGSQYNYVYLSYDSFIDDVLIVTKYSEKSWDNSISTKVNNKYDLSDHTYKQQYYINNVVDNEYVAKLKIESSKPGNISLYFSEDGNPDNLILFDNYSFDYAGIKSIDLIGRDVQINNNSYFQTDNNANISLSLFTKKNGSNPAAYTTDFEYDVDNAIDLGGDELHIRIQTALRNINDKEVINYQIKKENGDYLPIDAYVVSNNKSYYNIVTPIIKLKEEYAKKGKYYIETLYNNQILYASLLDLKNDYVNIAGSGTDEDPWQITSTRQFNMIRNNLDGNFILMNDLDFEYDTNNENGLFYNSGNGWEAIDYFRGNLDGNNKTIRNLKTSSGLFGYIMVNRDSCKFEKCGVHDLKVDNLKYTVKNSGQFSGNGGIINVLLINTTYKYNFSNLSVKDIVFDYDENVMSKTENIPVRIGGIVGQIDLNQNPGNVVSILKVDNWYSDYYLKETSYKGYKTLNYVGGLTGEIKMSRGPMLYINNVKTTAKFDINNDTDTQFYISDLIGHYVSNNNSIVSKAIINNAISNIGYKYNDNSIIYSNAFVGHVEGDGTGILKINGAKSTFDYVATDLITINNCETGLKPYNMAKVNYNNMQDYYEDQYYVYEEQKNNTKKVSFQDRFNVYSDKIPTLKKYPEEYSEYYKNYVIRVNEEKSILDLMSKDTNYHKYNVYNNFDCSLDICDNATDETIISVPSEENGFKFKGLKSGSTTLIVYDELSGYLNTVVINVLNNDEYKLTLEYNDGSSANEILKIKNNSTYGTLPVPENEGYFFLGWFTDEINGQEIKEDTIYKGNSDVTLYAHWLKNNHIVVFDSDGGSNVVSQTVNNNEKATKPNDPTKTGYTFREWQLNGVLYDFNTAVTSNITLTAVWTVNQYTVTFNSNGGSSVVNQTINYNGKVTKPSNPTKTGYTFVKWQLNGNDYDFNTAVTSNITLTAEWEINKYTVTFNSNGGSSVASQTVNYNSIATKPSNPTRTGYTFKKWLLNGSEYNFNTAVTSNITLTAEWQKDEEPADETLKELLQDNGYNVSSNYVSKFTIGDSIATIKSKLGSNVTIETNNSIISTGAIVRKGNESYTVVIKGDLNGDGKANSGDLLQMRKYLLEEINLTGAYKEAGIIESIGNIKSLDLLRLRQYLLGEYNFK